MIGKITIGKSFRGCLLYCLNDKVQQQGQQEGSKGRSEVLMYNRCCGSDKELIGQFNEVRQLNPNISRPVLHITLSLAPGEKLSKDKLMDIAEDCSREMGFEKNQFVVVSHRDTGHQHLHIVANRIGFDKRTVSDSNNYQKVANYCRKMELKHGLRQVLNPKRYLPKEQRNIPRLDQRKEQLKRAISYSLKECPDFNHFQLRMQRLGYDVIKGRGISFADEKKVKVKGSEVNYSLQTIERILEKQRNRVLKVTNQASQSKMHQFRKKSLPGQPNVSRDHLNRSSPNLLEQLTRSERKGEALNPYLLQKKKRRKQSPHL